MPGWIKPVLLLIILMLMSLAACSGSTLQPTVTSVLIPAVSPTSQPDALATPYALQPAAGICAGFEGTVVTITINPELPDPRCAKVKPDQTLMVVNNTQGALQVTIGKFTSNIAPGEKTMFDTPFGMYLAPGVHQLQVSPCCGSELWLESGQ